MAVSGGVISAAMGKYNDSRFKAFAESYIICNDAMASKAERARSLLWPRVGSFLQLEVRGLGSLYNWTWLLEVNICLYITKSRDLGHIGLHINIVENLSTLYLFTGTFLRWWLKRAALF